MYTEPGVYRHFKGGTYQVLGVGVHTETQRPYVIYHPAGEPTKPMASFTARLAS